MTWPEAIALIRAGQDVEHVLDLKSAADNEEFRVWFLKECGPEALASYDAKMRDVDSGVYGARMAWHSISAAQRRALVFAASGTGRLVKMNYRSDYGRTVSGDYPTRPIRIKTLRALCSHNLMAWDGGTFDPEAAAVVTERGRFVLTHGRTDK